MKRPATYEDANLMLRLYDLRREDTMRKARAWFLHEFNAASAEDFDRLYPLGSDGNAYYRQVTTYWEMAATFVVQGVLHQETFIHNSLEHLVVWIKAEPIVRAQRIQRNAPQMLKNLEAVAALAKAYLDSQGEGVYQSLEARFKR